jgi:LacI family transcriptional regulator
MTIKQVADLAGVSRGTVDRVLHNREGVEPSVRKRVQKILTDVDYKPNFVALALKSLEKSMTFGFIMNDMNNPFWLGILRGFRNAEKDFKSHGVRLKQLNMRKISPKEQIRCMDELLEGDEKISGLFIGGINSTEITAYINRISDTVPVITFNTDINGSRRLCFVGQNHLEAGHVAGRLMSMLLQKDGKIATFASTNQTLAHVDRFVGFRESLRKLSPNSVVLEPIYHRETDEAGYAVALQALKIPDIVAFYVTGEGSIGVAQALKESGRRPDIKMICYDMIDGIVKAVKDDIIDYTIGQKEYIQGYLPVKLMYEYLVYGTPPPNEKIYTDIDIRIKENIDYIDFGSV